MRRLASILITAVLLLAITWQGGAAQTATDERTRYTLSSRQAENIIAAPARQIMLALKNRDMRRLSSFVHPRRGVRFSPYVYVDTKRTRVLTRQQLVSLYRSNRRVNWGEADGSGDPILMTFRQYLRSFVYRQDLLKANQVAYNPENTRGPGTDINNLPVVYPRAILVLYSHEGITGPQGGAMDWQQLWLVFEKWRGDWYLVAIVNNEWTI